MKSTIFLITISVFAALLVPVIHDAFAIQGDTSTTLKNVAWETKVNKQVQITSDVTNNQDRTQPFAYLVQIQNQDGVVVSLSWLTGSLDHGQSLNPSQSWTPVLPGTYTAQIFVWVGINNPDALSPPLNMVITVT
ncbi:hypothetical protein HY212_01855 [Candidatus Pacearchaeota archaeon]|nr:hypothetical protein [Candidatus Pacearchaeota archaeon]